MTTISFFYWLLWAFIKQNPLLLWDRCITKTIQRQIRLIAETTKYLTLCVDKTSKLCNNFVLVLEPWPSQTKSSTNQTSAKVPNIIDTFPKLTHIHYLTLIDSSSKYLNLKVDDKWSYLMTFACQFDRYRYARLPFGAAPAGDMFLRKINEISKCYQMFLAL